MERKEEIGSLAFARQFQNEITSEGSSIFPEKLLEPLLDRGAGMVNPYGERPRWLKRYRLFMGVDLASSAAVGADYVVLVTVAVDEDKNRKLLHGWREKGVRFQEQIDEIIRLDEFFDYERIVIESNQYQYILPSTLKEKTDLPIMSYQMGAEKHTEDIGVPSLRILFENEKYKFPYGEKCREKIDTLLKELNSMAWDDGKLITTAAHKDTVMGLWLAEKGWIKDSYLKIAKDLSYIIPVTSSRRLKETGFQFVRQENVPLLGTPAHLVLRITSVRCLEQVLETCDKKLRRN